jgi:N-acetylneuraminic acid mutarotase
MSGALAKMLASAAVAAAMISAANAQGTNAQGIWTKKAPMAAAVNEVALAAVETKIHVIGGMVLGEAGPYHQEYDTEKDTWRARASLPKGLDHIGAAALNGKVYAIGGFLGWLHRDAQNAAYEYDPATDSWRILARMKAPRASVGVVALGGKIYAVGGRNPDGQVVATHEVYDPAPTSGRSSRRCRRRAITWRWWRRRVASTRSAGARAHRARQSINTMSTIRRPTRGRRDRRCRRRAAGLPGRITRI